MKKKIVSFALVIMALFIVTGCGNEEPKKPDNGKTPEQQNEPNANTNKEVIKTQTVDGLEISDIAVKKESGMSVVSGKVTNKTAETISLTKISVTVTNPDNSTSKLAIDVGDSIDAGKSVTFTSKTDADLMAATKIVYEVIK